ncbi:hypothetical protein [Streptomyces albus]|uniref:hypothetical protein n=1 Tax=Streptomyces albus TaxID=1888 RepID=UPI002A2FDDDA|nr:hypothetical protein TPA0909_11970 [Streptomyces albus]
MSSTLRHRHRERFTVVGNHLAQHRELSLLAIGLAVHIQSVPDGTRVDIKSLSARFPEGEAVSPPLCGSWRRTATWRGP